MSATGRLASLFLDMTVPRRETQKPALWSPQGKCSSQSGSLSKRETPVSMFLLASSNIVLNFFRLHKTIQFSGASILHFHLETALSQ